ncbi:hypothetical protein [Candidatus Caldatribacterium sp.]|uniref:hypothetical protein n=1 Tax=Candidatus Caldatribacterium sp. TaxID=2282143 RepID=UPI0029993493|nr:hypothetical protein [Candidatus Caldatribacterium sp.]MDW8082108.1 hypothetical protein [Candidatus Calescibacterium sp.]
MTAEEKLHLAEEIFEQLRKGMQRTSSGDEGKLSSEWTKWSAYAARKGLENALNFAKVMKDSRALRSNPRACYNAIFQVANNFKIKKDLEKLLPQDLAEVLGYVRWMLVAEKL